MSQFKTREEQKKLTKKQCISLWVFFLLIGLFLSTLFSSAPDTPDEGTAYHMSHEFIKGALKAPATAQFAPYSESQVIKVKENLFTVRSYVDAENSFGAKIRNHYTCTIEYEGNKNWRLITHTIN